MKDYYDCIVIGSGIAGFSAADAFLRYNSSSSMALITKEKVPLYSSPILPNYLAGQVDRNQVFMKHNFDYHDKDLNWIGSTDVLEIDRFERYIRLKGQSRNKIEFDRLIIATGSIPSLSRSLATSMQGLFTLKWFADAEKILAYPARSAVVVGSGLIGIEVAVALTCKGLKVTLVEALDHVMPLLIDKDCAEQIVRILKNNQVRVCTDTRVESIIGKKSVKGVTTANKDIAADMVILATGMTPNISLAQESGIAVGSASGVSVDSRMRTNLKNIFACGDCVESQDFLFGEMNLNLFWHVAKLQGLVAGTNAAGGTRQYLPQPTMASTDVFGIPIYSIGFTERALKAMGKEPEHRIETDGESFIKIILLDDHIVGTQLINRTRNLPFLIPNIYFGKHIGEIQQLDRKGNLKIPHMSRYSQFKPIFRAANHRFGCR